MSLSRSKCWYSNNCLDFFKHPVLLGLNEADSDKSSSCSLVYLETEKSIKAQNVGLMPMVN